MKLKKDIHGVMNRKVIYGRAGDEVKLIGAVLVEGKGGARYPVNAADLEENPPPPPPEKADKNKKPNSKPSLF